MLQRQWKRLLCSKSDLYFLKVFATSAGDKVVTETIKKIIIKI